MIDQSVSFRRARLSRVPQNKFEFNPMSKSQKECEQQMYADPPNDRRAWLALMSYSTNSINQCGGEEHEKLEIQIQREKMTVL